MGCRGSACASVVISALGSAAARPQPRSVFHLPLPASARHFLKSHCRPENGWLGRNWRQSHESQAAKGCEEVMTARQRDFVAAFWAEVAEFCEDDQQRTLLSWGSMVGR